MDFIPCPAMAPSEKGRARARRLVQVKFVALPMECPAPPRRSSIIAFLFRVIGRLVAARP